MATNFALFLARRQKRLKYWQESFLGKPAPDAHGTELRRLFARYQALLTTAAQTSDETERNAAIAELDGLDPKITSLFEDYRLLTSDTGVPAVTDYSTRGAGPSHAPRDDDSGH